MISWDLVNTIVSPEHQYKDTANPPLDNIRMAWPFKTEEELRLLSEWFKKQDAQIKTKLKAEEKETKRKEADNHLKNYGKALLWATKK